MPSGIDPTPTTANNAIPGPGVGFGALPSTNSTVGNNKGDNATTMVAKVRKDHVHNPLFDMGIVDLGNVCTSRKKTTDSGAAKNITPRTSHKAESWLVAFTARKLVTLQKVKIVTSKAKSRCVALLGLRM